MNRLRQSRLRCNLQWTSLVDAHAAPDNDRGFIFRVEVALAGVCCQTLLAVIGFRILSFVEVNCVRGIAKHLPDLGALKKAQLPAFRRTCAGPNKLLISLALKPAPRAP